jgi:Hexapeptide repeat of succinyl-transferase
MSRLIEKVFLLVKYARQVMSAGLWSRYYRVGMSINPAFEKVGRLRITGRMHWDVDPRARVEIGDNVRIHSGPLFNAMGAERRAVIAVHRGASLRIGSGTGLSNCTVICQQQVVIGRDVFVGGGVLIVDSDLHGIRPEQRIPHQADKVKRANVVIADQVFIGAYALVLKGVKIGEGAVIGAGAIVAKDIPAGEVWAGNPAKRIGHIDGSI